MARNIIILGLLVISNLLLTGCSYVYSTTPDTGKHHYNTTIKGARIQTVNGGVNGTTANGTKALQ